MKTFVVLLLLFVASSASGEIYTWKDHRGTAFYTNSLHEIPARYRSKARLLDVATGKKMPISAAESGGQAGSTASPGQPAALQQPRAQQAPATANNPGPSEPTAAYQGATTPPPASSKVTATTPSARPAVSSQPMQRQSRAERRAQMRQNRGANREE